MTKTNQNFTVYAGEDKDIVVTDDSGVDISAATEITWVMSESELSELPTLSKTLTGGGIAITNGPAGEFTITLAVADTQNVPHGHYYHEAEIALGGKVSKSLEGTVTLNPSQT